MFNEILNLEGVSVLNKKQQSEVMAGTCSVFVNTENGSYWSAQTHSVSYAQELYQTGGETLSTITGETYSITGYCCASCNEFQNHPSWDGQFPTR